MLDILLHILSEPDCIFRHLSVYPEKNPSIFVGRAKNLRILYLKFG